jgi:hypothetical protein
MTSTPAIEWLEGQFEQAVKHRADHRGARQPAREWHGPSAIRPMIELLSVMETGEQMMIRPADYRDLDRWWL